MVDYAPGIRIDWSRFQVELDGVVVLRDGPLELFACSPGTREHESIVAVQARPLHVFQALGLVGLQPGHPVTYDRQQDRWLPAAGDRLVIDVRYRAGSALRTVSAWDWILDAATGKRPSPREWLFCGSRRFPGGVFGADADGTVVCVVDFDTTLIGLAESHSADNALLWAAADPAAVPPAGTPCTLLLRPAVAPPLVVECAAQGRYRVDGAWVDGAGLREAARQRREAHPGVRATIRLLPEAPPQAAGTAADLLRQAGVSCDQRPPAP